jgi:hypothetical protein
MGRFVSTNKLVQLDLNGFRITVLRVLNQEDHQKRNDRCPGIDHQLPRITEAEERSGNRPQNKRSHSDRECGGTSGSTSRPLCEPCEERRLGGVHSVYWRYLKFGPLSERRKVPIAHRRTDFLAKGSKASSSKNGPEAALQPRGFRISLPPHLLYARS